MSGTDINSLNSAYPPAGTTPDSNAVNVEKDFADYKTLIYRMTLDIGAMANTDGSMPEGGAFVRHMTTNQTIPFADLPADKDIAGYSMVFDGHKFGEISIDLPPNYSVGRYTRDLSETVCQPNTPQENFQQCTRDVTGFKKAPDSFPADMSQYVGEKMGTPDMDQQQIRSMAGAPELIVSEVHEMKITAKPAVCTGRPAQPASMSDPWPGASPDCPWWYTQAVDYGGSGPRWAVDCEEIPHLGKEFCKDEATKCESGSCYHLDFHIDLGGPTENSRTLFGNPENDAVNGLEVSSRNFVDVPRV